MLSYSGKPQTVTCSKPRLNNEGRQFANSNILAGGSHTQSTVQEAQQDYLCIVSPFRFKNIPENWPGTPGRERNGAAGVGHRHSRVPRGRTSRTGRRGGPGDPAVRPPRSPPARAPPKAAAEQGAGGTPPTTQQPRNRNKTEGDCVYAAHQERRARQGPFPRQGPRPGDTRCPRWHPAPSPPAPGRRRRTDTRRARPLSPERGRGAHGRPPEKPRRQPGRGGAKEGRELAAERGPGRRRAGTRRRPARRRPGRKSDLLNGPGPARAAGEGESPPRVTRRPRTAPP